MRTESYTNMSTGSAAESERRPEHANHADEQADDAGALPTVARRHYAIGDEIARGGMGRVLAARDRRLDRNVAIKELLPDGRDRRDRFEREIRITAHLQHPAIIRIYEAGVWPNGEPFYAMPRVNGRSLDKVIAERATLADRLALLPHVIAAADALAYAHTQHVIHRDLKPANVLVGDYGETVVIDWGLAKRSFEDGPATSGSPVADAVADDLPTQTAHGAVIGTPNYMPPEQARGEPVDARADVYALGAMLYQLLVGAPPYPRGSADAILGHLLEGPPGPIRARERAAPLDLVAIVDKSMARERGARYADAAELVADLKRFETGQLVAARHYSPGQRAVRFVRRHAVIAGFALVLAAVGTASVVWITASRNQALAAREDADARNASLVLMQARAQLANDPTASLAWLKQYPVSAPGWSTALEIASDAWARGVAHDVWDFGKPIGSLAFSPDSRTLAIGTSDGTLTLVDVATGQRRAYHAADGVGDRVVFSPSGAQLATSDGRDYVRLWDRATGSSRRLPGEHVGGPRIEFSRDGTILLVRHLNGGTRLWRVPGGEPVALPGDDRRLVSFVGAAHRVVVVLGEELALFDLDTGTLGARIAVDGRVSDVSATADGRWIAASRQDSLALWDPATGATQKIAAAHNVVVLIAASGDGTHLMTCGTSQRELWRFDTSAGTAERVAGDERCYFQAFSFSPDGATFLSAGLGGELRLHLLAENQTRLLTGHQAAVTDAVFSPDGRTIASASIDHTVRIWRWSEGDVRVVHGVTAPTEVAQDGRIIVADASNAYSVLDVRSGDHEPVRDVPPNVRDVLLPATGGVVGFLGADHSFSLYDLATRTHRAKPLARDLSASGNTPSGLAPDRRTLAQIDQSGVVRVADLETGAARTVARLRDIGYALDISADSRSLAVGGRDGTARIVDIETGVERTTLECHGIVWSLAFSRTGTRVGAACGDGTVRVLDLATLRVQEFAGHIGAVAGIDFAADGSNVVSSGVDGTVRLWSLSRGRGAIVHRAPGPITSVHFVGDSSLIIERCHDARMLRMWDTRVLPPLRPEATTLLPWLDATTTAVANERGTVTTPAAHPAAPGR